MNETMDPKYKKWIKNLEKISNEISDLVLSKHVFQRIYEIVNDNNEINKGNLFYDWLSKHYGQSSLMGIRRLIDKNKKTLSLYVLLQDCAENNDKLSRSLHISLYSDEMKGLGESQFDDLAGEDNNSFPKSEIEKDIDKLENIRELLKSHINKKIAHLDKKEHGKIPTLLEIYNSVDALVEIAHKYSLIFTAADHKFMPVIQNDWESIFKTPWINKI
jgi:AbiU2